MQRTTRQIGLQINTDKTMLMELFNNETLSKEALDFEKVEEYKK